VKLAPGLSSVVAAVERTRLRSGVHGAVRGAHRQREHLRRGKPTVDPGAAAVRRAPDAAVPKPRVDRVGIGGIDCETLRAATGERNLGCPATAGGIQRRDRVAGRRVEPKTIAVTHLDAMVPW
jgi:hypothetical protein